MSANSTVSNTRLALEKVQRLIATTTRIADARLDLADCRKEILTLLIKLTEASAGYWAWGVSDDDAAAVSPIALIDIDFTAVEQTGIINMGLDPTMHEEFRVPIMKQMEREASSRCTSLRTDLYDDQEWVTKKMYANHIAVGFSEWMHCVNYSSSETWASLHLVRRTGSPPFQPADQQVVDLAMGSITWLTATTDRSLPAESCVALTARQRVVLMMQLDGLSRKEIAVRLQIATDTVGDHIKKIYEHFDISSSGELAALFLRNR